MNDSLEGKIDAHAKTHRIDLLHQLPNKPSFSFSAQHHYLTLQSIL